jgi:polyribonucleotide nucleotidyltransferase
VINGPKTQFGFGKIATLTESAVFGNAGETVVLATVATAPVEVHRKSEMQVLHYLRQRCRLSASFVPLTVDYRQRHHAVGKIPTNASRSDNKRPTDAETLASRAIDRALRPLLRPTMDAIHVSCSIQACPLEKGLGSSPVALALNSAAVALRDRLEEAVACVYLSVLENGVVVVSPSTPDSRAIGGLLYAGTRNEVVMMEFSGMLEESNLEVLITQAHACIQPILDAQEQARDSILKHCNKEDSDDSLRLELDLPLLDGSTSGARAELSSEDTAFEAAANQIYSQATEFCRSRLAGSALKLFGFLDRNPDLNSSTRNDLPGIHSTRDRPLLTKSHRARREHLVRQAVSAMLREFQPALDGRIVTLENDPSLVSELADAIHSDLLKKAMATAAVDHKARADNRATATSDGCNTIRPISLEVPVLPDVVHGSSLFTRGETQVLCTVTLGPPSDGVPLTNPFMRPQEEPEREPSLADELPVGSLRYLKTQEYLASDLNSRKVRADREQTGESGTLKERQRAFLQYDFPAFGNGEVQSGPRGTNRREVGHGALAEKAILPVLPSPSNFPYAIRMTSEVTGSNGSSSMASVCGATLALLDAGVPIKAPVAGLSVGLAKRVLNGITEYQLLVDITGTEDHYGLMDAKIAGTYDSVTAIHMDVHEPLPHHIVFDTLRLAKMSRGVLLDEMKSLADQSCDWVMDDFSPRAELKPSAPRVEVVRFDPMRKKDLLGPGGTVIRQMEDRFNVSLDLTQEGRCLLFGDDQEMVRKARVAVMDLVSDVEVGETYEGTIIEVRDFGVIVELLRNKEGLCHVSEMASRDAIKRHPQGAIGLVKSMVRVGQKFEVECIAVDEVMGTISLRPSNRKGYSTG